MFTYPDPANKPNILEFRIGSELRPDNVAIDILTHNDVPGVIPIAKKQVDDEIFITYDSGLAVPGATFLQTGVSDADAVSYVKSVTETLINAQRFMLDTNCFVLDPEHIYFDQTTTTAPLLYVPLKDQSNGDLRPALDDLIARLQASSAATLATLAQVREHLQVAESFELADFLKHVLAIQASSALPTNSAPHVPTLQTAAPPAPVAPIAAVPTVGSPLTGPTIAAPPTPVSAAPVSAAPQISPPHGLPAPAAPSAPPHGGGVRVPPSRQPQGTLNGSGGSNAPAGASTESSDKPMSIFYLMAHYSSENKRIYDEQRAARKAAKEAAGNSQPVPGKVPGSNGALHSVTGPMTSTPGLPATAQGQQGGGIAAVNMQTAAAAQPPQAASVAPAVGLYGLNHSSVEDFGQTVMFGQQDEAAPAADAAPAAAPIPATQPQVGAQPPGLVSQPGIAPYVPAPQALPNSGVTDAGSNGEPPVHAPAVTHTESAGVLPEQPKSLPRHATEITAMIVRKATGESIPITKPEFVIGRKTDNADLILADRTVSKQHATIYYEPTGWSIQDRGATNGVFVNGTTIEPGVKVAIESGATILLGDEELLFTIS